MFKIKKDKLQIEICSPQEGVNKNYYNEIKNELVNNEINREVKNYSINKSDLDAYYNVGRMLSEAGNHYGEGIIKEYSKRLTYELGKGYSKRNLWLMLKFYELNEKVQTVSAQLPWSHYCNYYLLRILIKLILEDIENFLEELGNGFTFIKSEYPVKLDNRYNYIDLLLYNIKYRCYVVVELKITELKKEHTGQIMTYMNYIDKNIKTIEENDIIICKQDNSYVIKYCSDDRIIAREY